MGKAARLKRERNKVKESSPAPLTPAPAPSIRLMNPHTQHFGAFTVGNALRWETQAHNELIRVDREAAESLEPYWGLMALIQSGFADKPAMHAWQRFRALVDEKCTEKFVAVPDSKKGQHVVICGAGPSLVEEAAEWVPQADEVWGCNSALTWLVNNGHRVTHGCTVDQTAEMLNEWETAPDVEYLLATTVHPHLTDHLLKQGRRVRWFNNFVGMKNKPVAWPDENGVNVGVAYEDWLYWTLFPNTVRCGSGLNTVTRAIDLALCLGFDKITVLGADCAMRVTSRPPAGMVAGSAEESRWLSEATIMHADGGSAIASNQSRIVLGAELDSGTEDGTIRPGRGRWWASKIDLLISARWLLVMERALKGRLNIVGDTYVNALRNKNVEFLNRLPSLVDEDDNPVEISVMGCDGDDSYRVPHVDYESTRRSA